MVAKILFLLILTFSPSGSRQVLDTESPSPLNINLQLLDAAGESLSGVTVELRVYAVQGDAPLEADEYLAGTCVSDAQGTCRMMYLAEIPRDPGGYGRGAFVVEGIEGRRPVMFPPGVVDIYGQLWLTPDGHLESPQHGEYEGQQAMVPGSPAEVTQHTESQSPWFTALLILAVVFLLAYLVRKNKP